jgi:hypothetical protein
VHGSQKSGSREAASGLDLGAVVSGALSMPSRGRPVRDLVPVLAELVARLEVDPGASTRSLAVSLRVRPSTVRRFRRELSVARHRVRNPQGPSGDAS